MPGTGTEVRVTRSSQGRVIGARQRAIRPFTGNGFVYRDTGTGHFYGLLRHAQCQCQSDQAHGIAAQSGISDHASGWLYERPLPAAFHRLNCVALDALGLPRQRDAHVNREIHYVLAIGTGANLLGREQ